MISLNGVAINSFNFPAGEECVRLSIEQMQPRDKYEFTWKYESSAEFFALQQAVSIVRGIAKTGRKVYISLLMPYFPFARQDRATVNNETNALTLFCDTIKTLDLDLISCVDPHSIAVEQHFAPENFHAWTQLDAVKSRMPVGSGFGFEIVIAPDEGALKKAATIAEYYSAYLITATKKRDPETGKIISYELNNSAGKIFHRPPQVLVVDDICDGGATFLLLGEALRKAVPRSEYTLFTTHGIYSKGRAELEKIYKQVICYNNMEKK